MGKLERFEGKDAPNQYEYKLEIEAEAWLAVLYACMYADGVVADSELQSLSRMLVHKEKFSSTHFSDYYPAVKEAIERLGCQSVIEKAAAHILEDDRPTLFVLAVEVVLADGIMTADEMEMIRIIADSLEIELELVDQIIQVMLIRNRGNLLLTSLG